MSSPGPSSYIAVFGVSLIRLGARLEYARRKVANIIVHLHVYSMFMRSRKILVSQPRRRPNSPRRPSWDHLIPGLIMMIIII